MSASSEKSSPPHPLSQEIPVDANPSAGGVDSDGDPTTLSEKQAKAAQEVLLKGPPRRPEPSPPKTITSLSAPAPASDSETSLINASSQDQASSFDPGQQPIPPPSEPMQYRAIGLVRGQYQPSEDQFNRGVLVTEDQVNLDAVLLGQVLSLVKKYVDLEEFHYWVVYPRTRDKEETLHLQIVGVWSAGGFGPLPEDTPSEEQTAASELAEDPQTIESSAAAIQPIPLAPPLQDGYFSIRGEIVFQSLQDNFFLVKIQQAPRKNKEQAKAFKLKVMGSLPDKTLGYFWDLQVLRQGGRVNAPSRAADWFSASEAPISGPASSQVL
ncbi:MAG: hypothetical protein HC934_12850 [Acaryochloridaceae cyanobacterium SU_2_1]|nr:hypothetical protein [Acaryochloridaceae cyanobacterium SU_2_1]